MIRRIIAAVLIMIFIACSAISMMKVCNAQRCWAGKIATAITPCKEKELSVLAALYPDSKWAAFQQIESKIISSNVGGFRKAKVSILLFHGTPESIAFFPMMAGRIPMGNEDYVCAMDRETAFELFRSVDVLGSRVSYEGKELQVVGILSLHFPLVIVPGDAETEYTHIAADNRDALTALVSTLGDETDPFDLSGMEVARLLWILCAIPWAAVILRAIRKMHRRPGFWKVISNVTFSAVLLGMLIAFLNCIPIRLLPARWSDLSFFGEQISAFRKRPYRIPTARDVMLGQDILRTCIWCVLAFVTLRMERKVKPCEKLH